MKYTVALGVLAASAFADKLDVNPTLLQADIVREHLWAGAGKLQSFADATKEKNRMVAGPAEEATIQWLKDSLEALDYYDVSLQTFPLTVQFSGSINAFAINATAVPKTSYSLFQFSPSGNATAPLMFVDGGCNKTDYPANLAGKIAIIPRGTCEFGLKSTFAGSAAAHLLGGTLLAPPRPEGPYVPTLNVIQGVAAPVVSALKRGESVTASLDIVTDIRKTTPSNLLATTKSGDQSNKLMLGAHTDSVAAGPGINDNGSGITALLEVAKALPKYEIKNAVTFAFWTAEEEGLLGSKHFVNNLPAAEAANIRGYLNFDMIASPNYVNSIYDGSGKAFGVKGPAGSAQFQQFSQDYFKGAGKNSTATELSGRSDHMAFLVANIPVGGTFTGAEQNKTVEEVALFGGQAGQPYDHCYHQACDTLSNLNMDAFELHAKGIAAAVATYATSWEGFPARNTTQSVKRSEFEAWNSKRDAHVHEGVGCSHDRVTM